MSAALKMERSWRILRALYAKRRWGNAQETAVIRRAERLHNQLSNAAFEERWKGRQEIPW